jgi:FkbM family methyltransferase
MPINTDNRMFADWNTTNMSQLSQLDINSHSTFQILRWLQETRGFTLQGKDVLCLGSHDLLEHDGFVHYGARHILAVECNPYVLPDLYERTKNRWFPPYGNGSYEKGVTQSVEACLWSECGLIKTFTFFKDEKYGAGSLFGNAKLSQYVPECQPLQETKVMLTKTLDYLFEARNLSYIDNIGWVSLDVQGSELEVLKGAKTLMEARPEVFYTEVSWDNLYEGAPLIGEIDRFFTAHRYERIGLRQDIQVQGDAIYVKI